MGRRQHGRVRGGARRARRAASAHHHPGACGAEAEHPEVVTESARACSYHSVSRDRSFTITMLAVEFWLLNFGCTRVSKWIFDTLCSIFKMVWYISVCFRVCCDLKPILSAFPTIGWF